MKKLVAIAFTALFMAAVLTPAATAFGDCAGKSHGGGKTAEQPKPDTTKA